MSAEDEVRKASDQFYAALSRMANGNADALADIWSHGATASAMHPIGGREVGWDAVRTSFEGVAEIASDGKVEIKDRLIRIVGDMAYELGNEQGKFKLAGEEVTIENRVTNIYEREAGVWKISHHHTDISPAMQDILSRL